MNTRAMIEKSFVDNSFNCSQFWNVIPLQTALNSSELETAYSKKKQELLSEGRTEEEIEDKILFGCSRTYEEVETISRTGLQVGTKSMNVVLGNASKGVSLGKNADVFLRSCYKDGLESCWIVVYKVTLGRVKGVLPIQTPPYREPAADADCHCSFIAPSTDDELRIQEAKSQVYIYERDELHRLRPRQCVPFAVAMFTRIGSVMSGVDLTWRHEDAALVPTAAAGSVEQMRRLGGLNALQLPPPSVGSITVAACTQVDVVSLQQNGRSPKTNGLVPAAGTTASTHVRLVQNEAANGCRPQQTSSAHSRSQFASVTSAFLDSLVKNTSAPNYNQANDPRCRTNQSRTSVRQQQQPPAQPHVLTSGTSVTMQQGNSEENPRAQYSHLIRSKLKPTSRDPRSQSNAEAAVTPPGDVRASDVRPSSAVENVRSVPNVPASTAANFASNSLPSQIVLLQHQHQLVSDITRQLSADLNTVANFLRATKPENIDAEEMTALQSMQDINAAFQRLTPICVKYRRFCQSTFDTSSASVLSASVDVSLLPDPSCLLRQDIRLRQCRDGLRQIFDYRKRLMMLTVRAAEQRTLTFNWLRQHSPSVTQCIGWLIQVLGEVFDRSVTAGYTATAAAAVTVLPELSASQKALTAARSEQRASRQTSSEKQMRLKVDASTRNLEVRDQQLAIPSSHSISAAHQPQRIVTTTTANNVQAADDRSLTQQIPPQSPPPPPQQQQQQQQQQQVSWTSDNVPVTSLPSPPVVLSLVKAERTTTNTAPATPPRSARPETIIFDADDVAADADWPPTAAFETSRGTVSNNSSFISELLPPCLTPASMKQDLGDVNNDDAPPVLLPCNQSVTAAEPSTDSGNVTATGSGVTSSLPTTAAVEGSGAGVSSGLSGLLSPVASSSSEENTKLLEPGTTENITSADATRKRAPTPFPRGTEADQCDEEERGTTTAAQNNNNNNQNNVEQKEEEEEEEQDVCKEQLRRLLDARDQKTFSRLLIDSVCSMPANQFSRVREMLIRTLVERRQLAEVAAASATAGEPSTSVTVEQRTSTSGSGGVVKNVGNETDASRELNLKIENVFSCDEYNGSTVDSEVVGGAAAAAATAAAAAIVVVVNSDVLEDDTKDSAARMELKWMSLTDADNCDVSGIPCLQNPTGFGSGSGSGVNVHNYITIEPEDDGHEMQLPVSVDAVDSKLPVVNEHQTSQMSCSPPTQPPRSNVDGGISNSDVSEPFRMFMSERQQQLIQQQTRPASPEKKIQPTDVSLSVENRCHLTTISPDQVPVSPTPVRELSCADCTPQVFPPESVHLSPSCGAREPVRSPLATRSDNAGVQQQQQQQLQSVDCGNRSTPHEAVARINDQPRPSWFPRHPDESLPPDELPVVRGAPAFRAPPRVADHQQPVYYQSLTMSVSGGHAAELCRNFFAMSKFLRGEEAVRLNAADATRQRERLERDSFSRVSRSFSDERPHDILTAATRVKPDADAIQPRQAAVADDDQKRFPVCNYFRNEVNREAGGHGALYSDQRSRRSPVNVSERRSVPGRRTGSPDRSTQRPNVIDYRKIYIRSSPNYRGRPYGPEITRYRGAPPHIAYRERKLSEEHQFFRRRTHRRVSSRSPGTDGYESDGSGRAFKRARSNNSKMSDSPGRSSRGPSLETNEGRFLSASRTSRTSDEICRRASDSSKTTARTPPAVGVLNGKQQGEANYVAASVVKSPTLSDVTVTDERRHFYHRSNRCDGRSTRSTSHGSRGESRDNTRGEVRPDTRRRKSRSRSRSRSGRRSPSNREDRVNCNRSRQRSPDRTQRRRSRSRSRDYRKHDDVGKSRSTDRRVSSAERNCRQEVDGGDGSGERGDIVGRRSRSPCRRNVSERSDQQGNVTCVNGRPTVAEDNNCRVAVEREHATSFIIRSPSRFSDAPGVQAENAAAHIVADIECAEPVVIPTENRADVAAGIDDVTTVSSLENANQAEQLSIQSAVTPRRQRSRMQQCVIQVSSDDENQDDKCAPRNEGGRARILTSSHQVCMSVQTPTLLPPRQTVATSTTDGRLDSPLINLDRIQQRRPRTPLELAVPTAVSSRSSTTFRRSSPPGPESPIHQRHDCPTLYGAASVKFPVFLPRNVALSTSQQFVRTKTEPGLPVADDNEDDDCISLLSPTDPPPSRQSEDSAIINKTRNFVSPLFTYSHQRNVDQSVRLFSDDSGQRRADAATGAVSSKSLGDSGGGGGASGHGKDRPVVFLVTGLSRKPVTQTSTSPDSGQRNDASVADSR